MSRRTSRKRRAPQTAMVGVLLLLLLAFLAYRELGGRIPTTSAPGGQPGAPRSVPGATSAPGGQPGAPTSAPGTASWYELYFTTPKYPDKPEYHRGSLDEKLVAFINTETKTIDLADYDFDLENVANALAQAVGRGVRIRMVTDTDTLTNDDPKIQKAFDILKQAKIPIVDDQRGPIMHNKFMVVDGAAVWTGSWNFTDGDTYRLNNNAIKIASPDLAQNYTAEFEKMF